MSNCRSLLVPEWRLLAVEESLGLGGVLLGGFGLGALFFAFGLSEVREMRLAGEFAGDVVALRPAVARREGRRSPPRRLRRRVWLNLV